MKNILFTTSRSHGAFERLMSEQAKTAIEKTELDIDFLDTPPKDDAEWNTLLKNYDGVLSSWGTPNLSAEILDGNERLKVVAHAAGSVADLVSEALYSKGIRVTTANSVMARGVAEWCLRMTLNGWSNMYNYSQFFGHGNCQWDAEKPRCIEEARIGIWGYGNISQAYIKTIKALRPKEIMVVTKYTSAEELASKGLKKVSLEEMFAQSDILVLLAALTDANLGRVDQELLETIKDQAVLLNAGRARLIQENALLRELEKERFSAFLDVHYDEPMKEDSPFRSLSNVLLTPHCGGAAMTGCYISEMIRELELFFKRGKLIYEVKPTRAATMTSHKKAEVEAVGA